MSKRLGITSFRFTPRRRFPLSPKHRPIRPARRPVQHHVTLTTFSTITAGRQMRTAPIGLPGVMSYSLSMIESWLINHHKAENVRVTAVLPEDARADTKIECRWTSKPRLGQKNRAYLAAHGIQV